MTSHSYIRELVFCFRGHSYVERMSDTHVYKKCTSCGKTTNCTFIEWSCSNCGHTTTDINTTKTSVTWPCSECETIQEFTVTDYE